MTKTTALILAMVVGCGGSAEGGDTGPTAKLATCSQPASCTSCTVKVNSGSCSTVSGCCTCALGANGLTVTFDGQLSGMVAEQSFYQPSNVAFDYGNAPTYSASTCSKSFGLTWPDATAAQRAGTQWSFSVWLPQWGAPTH